MIFVLFTLLSICGEVGAFDNFDEDVDDFVCEFSVAEMLFDWKFGCDCCWMCEIIVVENDNCVEVRSQQEKKNVGGYLQHLTIQNIHAIYSR